MALLSFDEKYQAIGTQDTRFEGQFITAVKTTGVFCRPSCRARKPLRENVIFYDTPRQALQEGYRPCKVCRPMEPLDQTPDQIQALLNELGADPELRIRDQDLRDRGLDPSRIRRWFNKHHGMTFQAYQRMLRVNAAYQQLNQGRSVTEAAFDAGYSSLSGFNDSYKTIFGVPPGRSSEVDVLQITRLPTPLGPIFAVASSQGLCLLEFTDRRALENQLIGLRKRLKARILPGPNPYLDQVQTELAEYFHKQRKAFTVPLHTPGTEFQRQVWKALEGIPYGETRSYQEQARQLGKPKAVRAVASANGQNRIAILIPCHRVIGSDGSLVGYGGGLERKKWLLAFESGQLQL